jgi:RNA polymerase sigma factor (sigma-70 family)
MARLQEHTLFEYIRGVLAETDPGSLSDRELLDRFAARHDEVAFKTILRRHGPMVLGVCQRLLKRREDAEDVFQATFLVLARKVGTLPWRESVGSWLYEVAHRLAQEARRKQLNQQAREARARVRCAEDPLDEITGRELVAILDEQLASMPERYRAPLVLCCLEGRSSDEAARDLGCSLSTLKRRLHHARKLLQRQLKRKGFTLPAVLSALLVHRAASASVSPTLAATTVQAATCLGTGAPLTAGLISAEAVALAGSLAPAVLVTPVKLVLGALLLGGILVAGGYALARHQLAAAVASPPAAPASSVASSPAKPQLGPRVPALVRASVETTLGTAGEQVRQLAFDGDPSTFFASARNVGRADHFTLRFDQPVAVQSVTVATGRPQGGEQLDAGVLEGSADGTTFTALASFAAGEANGWAGGRRLRAVRVRPAADLLHALAIREIVVDSDPPVAVFKYPVEFAVDVSEAPEMRAWAEQAARACERAYPMINEELKNEASRRGRLIRLTLRKDLGCIAASSNGQLTGSAAYFRAHPDDVGAMVHTTVYVVQGDPSPPGPFWRATLGLLDAGLQRVRTLDAGQGELHRTAAALQSAVALARDMRGRGDPECEPRWLVGGIADYVRFFKYEPGKLHPVDPEWARYDSHTQTTAAFLAYLAKKYDPEIVRKLSQIVREGAYHDEVFQSLTGKSLAELDAEWRETLPWESASRQ